MSILFIAIEMCCQDQLEGVLDPSAHPQNLQKPSPQHDTAEASQAARTGSDIDDTVSDKQVWERYIVICHVTVLSDVLKIN